MNYGFIRFLPDLKFQGGQQSVHPSKEHDQGAQEHDQTKVSSTDKNYKYECHDMCIIIYHIIFARLVIDNPDLSMTFKIHPYNINI